jgi:hypothetical protein
MVPVRDDSILQVGDELSLLTDSDTDPTRLFARH